MHLVRLLLITMAMAILAGCAANQNSGSVGIRMSDIDGRALSGTRLGLKNGSGLSTPTDLWDRIRRGFAIPDLDTGTVRDRESWYTQRPDYIERMIGRSNKYIYHIVEELERRGMPTELALLPFVESAFNPGAVSSAKAAGMWQFIPSTGKQYDLRQNMFLDDRRDVLRSTKAALDYLQKLYTMFGDWQLALAAYNWGEGNVQRAIQRNQNAGLGTRYQDLNMPTETRQYVPKLQAIKNIIRNPATFNTALPNVANHPYFDTVEISRDMDVAMAARLAEITEGDFKALNPSLNKPLIIASIKSRILLPWESVPTFRKNLANMQGKQLASSTLWTAPANMSVAQAAQQSGTTEDKLRDLNHIPPRMMVKAGSTLLVPRPDGQTADISSATALAGNISFTPEVVLTRTTLRAHKGDTIAIFAQRYELSPETVANWNGTSTSAALQAGQHVVVHLPRQQANKLLNRQRAEAAQAAREARLAAAAKSRKEDEEDEEDTPSAGKGKPAKAITAKAGKGKSAARDDDEDEAPASAKGRRSAAKGKQADEEKPGGTRNRKAGAKARADDDEDDARPTKGKKPAARGKQADDEDEKPARTRKPATRNKADEADEDARPAKDKKAAAKSKRADDDEDAKPAKVKPKAAKARASAKDDDDEDAKPAGKTRKPAGQQAGKRKAAAADDDDDEKPARGKGKTPEKNAKKGKK